MRLRSLAALLVFSSVSFAQMVHNEAGVQTAQPPIPTNTAQRLYLISLSSLDSPTLHSYLKFNLGLQSADITAATKVIGTFRTRYAEEVNVYNASVRNGFNAQAMEDFSGRRDVVVSDSLEAASTVLSMPGFRTMLVDIQRSKSKIALANVVNASTNPMTCCYNIVQNMTTNIVSTSPPHLILTRTLTIEGNVTQNIPPGPMHYPNLQLRMNGHTTIASGPRVTPATYIQFSASQTLDSSADSCVLNPKTVAMARTSAT